MIELLLIQIVANFFIFLFQQTPSLTFIDARNCDLNDRVMPIFGRALRMGCFLQRLQLQSTNISGRSLVILGKYVPS